MCKLNRGQIAISYGVIAIVLVVITCLFAWVGGWIGWPGELPTLTPSRIVDALEATGPKHFGFRRNHAKGVCVSGQFESNGNGAEFSRAKVFDRGVVPVDGRLSAPGSDPTQEDFNAQVRSLALRFAPKGEEQWRTAMNSTPVFPVSTPEAFYEQLLAFRPDPQTGKPNTVSVSAFLAKHPETRAFRSWLDTHPPSSKFYNASYFSINAFRFTDSHGVSRFVRWSAVPDLPYAPVSASSTHDPDFLLHDLVAQLAKGPVRWHLILTPAGPNDPINDATRMWPPERDAHSVDAGTIVIARSETQIDGACRDINFDPLILPDGIAPSNDPLLSARSGAYAVSFDRRIREQAGWGIHPR